MKRLIAILLGLSLLLAANMSVYAKGNPEAKYKANKNIQHEDGDKNEENRDFYNMGKFGELKNVTAVVAGMDATGKLVLTGKNGNRKSVDVSAAVIVKITEQGSHVVAITDLVVGTKATFLVGKDKGETYKAALVYQFVATSPVLPKVEFSAVTGSGLESVTAVNIPVTVTGTSTKDVKVNYSVTGGTATGGGVDYTLVSDKLVIPAGQNTGNIVFSVVDDTTVEPDETLTVTLWSSSRAIFGANTNFTYTITNND